MRLIPNKIIFALYLIYFLESCRSHYSNSGFSYWLKIGLMTFILFSMVADALWSFDPKPLMILISFFWFIGNVTYIFSGAELTWFFVIISCGSLLLASAAQPSRWD